MRYIVIGDIHGCLNEFQELITVVAPAPEDRVICLGDFMDKGPEPVACLRFARERGFTAIKGNHEERHWKWRRNVAREKADPSYKNAMRPFHSEAELRQNAELSQADLDWIESLPYYLEFVPGFVAVHGGLLPKLPLSQQPLDKIVRARWVDQTGKPVPTDYESDTSHPPGTLHWTALYDGPYHVIYGHEAHSLKTPRVDTIASTQKSCYGIDTGCVHGGRLTALVLDQDLTVNFVQVQARQKYAELQWGIAESS